ncbi:ABC transporter permease [Natrononativus amylolyticus]|uniref:ABC transporter permease n=1 Tax=Natrononativus amylolyticus TaxID=2963434 RepID=UPI0020CC96A4|nr:ABC transporter permease [Natrononativus amylolyticus]
MSTEHETFEDVDWDEIDRERGGIPLRTVALVGTYTLLVLAFLYDWLVLPSGVPLIEVDGVGSISISPVDWLFIATMLALFFFVVIPLYQNKRMTLHYWAQFKQNRMAILSLIYLFIIFLIGTIGPLFLDPPRLEMMSAYQPPIGMTVDSAIPLDCTGTVSDGNCYGTWSHPFGTTHEGKDILVSVIYGMQVSMKIGLISTLIIIVIATIVGTASAYFGGAVDEILMRYVDIQITFPTFFLYLLLVYLIGGSLFVMIVIFGLTGWGGIARIVRSEALQRREESYIMAAQNAGASGFYIMRHHLVPNVSNSVITAATLLIPGLILYEAALSFLGLGDPTIPSWGQVIADGRNDLHDAWWISTIPGIFLFMTILAFNFLGDALRDALDPRLDH